MESTLRAGADDQGLRLIETLRWDGQVLVRLPLHLDRLQRSAAMLGWGCDPVACAAALRAAAPMEAARMRLTLARGGVVEVASAALPEGCHVWRLGVAEARLLSGDPWLGVKSTRRAAYDAARAGMASGLDEVIFLNERAEVCDGTITTVFFDRGAGLRTPPLASGLLPGVLRAELAVPEEVLRAQDLRQVRLWVGNSMRGLCAARLTDQGAGRADLPSM